MVKISIWQGFDIAEADVLAVRKVVELLNKNPDVPGLTVENVAQPRDPHVRIAYDSDTPAIIYFDIIAGEKRQLIFVGAKPLQEAHAYARRLYWDINPVNGISALIEDDTHPEPEQVLEPEVVDADGVEKQEVAASLFEQFRASGIDDICAELGLSEHMRAALEELTTAKDLLERRNSLPKWEIEVVLSVYGGASIEEVQEEYDLSTIEFDDTLSSEDQLLAGLQHPVAQMEFKHDPDEEELNAILESQDFNAWRIYVHPQQRSIISAHHKGSARVTGGAGTGKTVVVVHRAHWLAEQNPQARILLTTFTRSLAESLHQQMNILDPNFREAPAPGEQDIWICGIDSLVNWIHRNVPPNQLGRPVEKVTGLREFHRLTPLDGNGEDKLWQESILLIDDGTLPDNLPTSFFKHEYETVVLTQRITTQQQYLRASRQGRGVALNRAQRKVVWSIIHTFQQKCLRMHKAPFTMLACIAAEILIERQTHLFDHVLVDEAQDFHVGHWRFLRALVAAGPNDIFLAEDSHQRIYGQRLVLSRFGIETRGGASRKLSLNYRTTRENLDYAVKILEGVDASDQWLDSEGEEDNLNGYRSLRTGPAPIVLRTETQYEEVVKVAEQIHKWRKENPTARIGILVRSKHLVNQIIAGMESHDIDVTQYAIVKAADDAKVRVLTMHNAKGLEFNYVVLMGVSKDAVPQQYPLEGAQGTDLREGLLKERALLYVAASRARDALMITTVGTQSEFLPKGH